MLPPDAVFIGEARKSRGQVAKVFVGSHDGMAFIYLSIFNKERGQSDDQAVDLCRGLTLRPACWEGLLPILGAAVSKARQNDAAAATSPDEPRMTWDRPREHGSRRHSGRRDHV